MFTRLAAVLITPLLHICHPKCRLLNTIGTIILRLASSIGLLVRVLHVGSQLAAPHFPLGCSMTVLCNALGAQVEGVGGVIASAGVLSCPAPIDIEYRGLLSVSHVGYVDIEDITANL
jgi:hypothetical protein